MRKAAQTSLLDDEITLESDLMAALTPSVGRGRRGRRGRRKEGRERRRRRGGDRGRRKGGRKGKKKGMRRKRLKAGEQVSGGRER